MDFKELRETTKQLSFVVFRELLGPLGLLGLAYFNSLVSWALGHLGTWSLELLGYLAPWAILAPWHLDQWALGHLGYWAQLQNNLRKYLPSLPQILDPYFVREC
jgi:hypothetical protein